MVIAKCKPGKERNPKQEDVLFQKKSICSKTIN